MTIKGQATETLIQTSETAVWNEPGALFLALLQTQPGASEKFTHEIYDTLVGLVDLT